MNKTDVSDREKRATYVKAFGREFDDKSRKQTPLPLDIAYQVAVSALSRKLAIEKSNSSYGNYSIRISETETKFFWKKKDAVTFLNSLLY